MIQLNNISLSFGSQVIFKDLSLNLQTQDKIGLVGNNGTGKTTLLKVITKKIQLDSGSVNYIGDVKIAYLSQEMVLQSKRSIFEEVMQAYANIGSLRLKAKLLEQQLVEDADGEVVSQYAQIMEDLQEYNVGSAERETENILLGLGFKKEQLTDSVTTLSVGWQMRVVLAKLLVQKADFYLFDEPTNHLDIVAKDWFLQFLEDANFGFLLVSHDKYFLDTACEKIIELENGKGTLYYGNYQHYQTQKAHDLELLQSAALQQEKELKKKQEWVDKFRAKASKAKLAKSVEKSLQKVKRIVLPESTQSINLQLNQAVDRSGKIVLQAENISFSFGQKTIFRSLSFKVERGQKIAIVAPNGAGKTTLFNVLSGKYQSKTGLVEYGYNVNTSLFEQEQHKILDPKKTIIKEVLDTVGNKTEQEVRTFLGSFLFSADAVLKKTKVLSGGERNRVSMVKVLLQDANFLMLDEPTNHLDIPSKEILLKALQQFEGTILFVSHDHEFVNNLATHILELKENKVALYAGNYDLYKAQKGLKKSIIQPVNQNVISKKQIKKNNNKQLYQIEKDIIKLENQIKNLEESFLNLEYATHAFSQSQKKLDNFKKDLDKLMHEWEKLQD